MTVCRFCLDLFGFFEVGLDSGLGVEDGHDDLFRVQYVLISTMIQSRLSKALPFPDLRANARLDGDL